MLIKRNNLLPQGFQLRDYQTTSIDRLKSRLVNDRFGLVVLAVGLGKSWVMVGIAEYFKRVVVLQPCLELVKQNHEKLTGAGMDTAMIDSAHRGSWNADFIYTTPQTLVKHLHECQEPDLLIVDECNVFYEGKLFNQIFGAWHNCKVAGFTATPYYYRRKTRYKSGWMWSETTVVSIEEQYGPAVINVDRETGHALGFSPDIEIRKVDIPICNNMHLQNPAVYAPIIRKHLEGVSALCKTLNNGIIFCDSITHAELISSTFNLPTIFGDTPKKVREDRVARFNQGRIPFLVTVGCLVRGYDRPDLENIILLSNFHNACEFEQVLGRLNRGTGKKTCWYNGVINKKKPVPGNVELVKIKRL